MVSPCPSPPRPSSVHDPFLVQPTPTPQSQLQPHQNVLENTQNAVSDGPAVNTTRSASVPIPAVISALQEGVSSSPSRPHSVHASPVAPPAPPVVVSVAQSSASTSTNSTPTSMRTRKTSTFRHVPSRTPMTPVAPSPLSIGNSPHSLPSRNLDLNKASRPQSRLSTVTHFGNSSPAEASHDAPISKTAPFTQPQGDTESPSLTKPSGATSSLGTPVSMQRTRSETPSYTPAAPSPVTSPSPSSVRTSTLVRSPAPYRPGFQPKGAYRPLTDEFLEVRRSHRDSGRVEQTRLERRLEKLINLHFGEDTDKKTPARPKQAKRMSSIWELDIRNMAPGDLWRGVIQSQVASGSKADIRGVFSVLLLRRVFDRYHRLVAAEQSITPWQSDADVSQCPSCTYVA